MRKYLFRVSIEDIEQPRQTMTQCLNFSTGIGPQRFRCNINCYSFFFLQKTREQPLANQTQQQQSDKKLVWTGQLQWHETVRLIIWGRNYYRNNEFILLNICHLLGSSFTKMSPLINGCVKSFQIRSFFRTRENFVFWHCFEVPSFLKYCISSKSSPLNHTLFPLFGTRVFGQQHMFG